jgi:RND superfamily putative drug exporter
VLYSLTFLPALLAILGARIDALPVLFVRRRAGGAGSGVWPRLATLVMARPLAVLVPVVLLLVLLGLPVRHLELGTGDLSILPAHAESRRGEEVLRREFPGNDTSPLVVVLDLGGGGRLTAERVGQVHDLSRWLARLPGVARVDSIVDLPPSLTRAEYVHLASLPADQRPPEVREAFAQTVGPHVITVVARTTLPPGSAAAHELVRTIRSSHPPVDARVLVTGLAAFDLDFVDLLWRAAPAAIGFIVLATYVVLFFLLGSILLPVKAIVMNVLSISASYGALVWIFQEGHLAGWLGFTPAPIEPAIPMIMFCVLFGLSMDYEVLLLSRTREEWDRTGDNTRAVAWSLERTGRLITGAAAIMAGVFFGFGTAHAVMIKAMGIGMGIAVVVDATIVRALLVPATMRLLGRWNWWAPAPLARLYRRLGQGESPA